MFRYCAVILVVTLCIPLANSAETKPQWRIIEQPMFSLIYEANVHEQAERVAAQLNHYLSAHLTEMPLKRPLKPIPIVLYSRAHTSNGDVGIMPYRSRWFNKPAPFAQLEWYDALAVHEGRHIVQFNQMNDNSIANALRYALGDLGTGAFAALFLPTWFFEGDAVVSETLMTAGGRGRTASFDLWYRTDLIENQPYQYDRAMLGTGFDRTPSLSPYVLGRYLTAYLRNEYGSDIFDRAINGLAIPKGVSFDGTIKQETGLSLTDHYQQMTQALTNQWQEDQQALALTPIETLTEFSGDHWQSYYPVSVSSDRVYAVKVDAKLGTSLVSIREGRSQQLTPLSNRVAQSYFGGSKTAAVVKHNDQWCWIEEKPNAKVPFNETADLYCWSRTLGERQLSVGDRFTYVGTSQKQFLLNRFNVDRSSELVLLDQKGGLLQVESLPNNSIAYDIQSIDNGWLYVLSGSANDGVYKIDSQLEETSLLKANNNETIRSPILTENWLLYISDKTGIDQVHALSLQSGKNFQVSTRPYGSYFLQWDAANERIVMSDYTAQGQQLVSLIFNDSQQPPSDWIEVEDKKSSAPIFMENLEQFEPLQLNQATIAPLESQRYTMLPHLWNPHSWSLLFTGDQLNLTLNSEDVMEKLNLQFSGGYDVSAEDWFGQASLKYRADAGPFYSTKVEKLIDELDQTKTSIQLVAEQPIERYSGVQQSQWLPYLGLERTELEREEPLYRVLYGVGYQRQQERAFQAIDTPSGFAQSLAGQYYINENTINWLSTSQLIMEGLQENQSVDFSLSLQHLNYPVSMLSSNTLFEPIDQLGYSAQMEANFGINFGAVGRSFTPLLYWRNTEASLNFLSQHTENDNDLALGFSVSPNVNVLRNANIRLKPSVSIYYLPRSEEFNLRYQVSLGGF
ncbi:hypothetical protein [Reinekea sp.]|uniref:hypothetical protein n=1 Tax=Reinekea sp. TaxID=1970455 RepID=UPI003988B3C8